MAFQLAGDSELDRRVPSTMGPADSTICPPAFFSSSRARYDSSMTSRACVPLVFSMYSKAE